MLWDCLEAFPVVQQYCITVLNFGFYESICCILATVLSLYLLFLQERIRVGKELLEAKRIEEENERKRFVFI